MMKNCALQKAYGLEKGLRLTDLYMICDNQKTISTRKLFYMVSAIHEDDKKVAALLRKLAT